MRFVRPPLPDHPLSRHSGGNNQYRIKSLKDGHERIVKESDLALGFA